MSKNEIEVKKMEYKQLPPGLIIIPAGEFSISNEPHRCNYVMLRAEGDFDALAELIARPFAPKIYRT